jgi:hypothetical protein
VTSEVPLYPLAPIVFVLVALSFVLQMACHLRVCTAARPSPVWDPAGIRTRADRLS